MRRNLLAPVRAVPTMAESTSGCSAYDLTDQARSSANRTISIARHVALGRPGSTLAGRGLRDPPEPDTDGSTAQGGLPHLPEALRDPAHREHPAQRPAPRPTRPHYSHLLDHGARGGGGQAPKPIATAHRRSPGTTRSSRLGRGTRTRLTTPSRLGHVVLSLRSGSPSGSGGSSTRCTLTARTRCECW